MKYSCLFGSSVQRFSVSRLYSDRSLDTTSYLVLFWTDFMAISDSDRINSQ